MVFTMGYKGISSLVPGAPPRPLPSLTFVPAEMFLSHFSHASLTQLLHGVFLTFIKYVITDLPPELLIGSALVNGGFILEIAGTGFIF